MGYCIKDWKRRLAERIDMCSFIVHLTHETKESTVEDVLYKILSERIILGSTTTSGFICGNTKAVCFQDTPLTSICRNVFYEQKKIEQNKDYKIR